MILKNILQCPCAYVHIHTCICVCSLQKFDNLGKHCKFKIIYGKQQKLLKNVALYIVRDITII